MNALPNPKSVSAPKDTAADAGFRWDDPFLLDDQLTYDEFLTRGLRVADATSISLCRDNHIDMVVFNLSDHGNIARVVQGEKIGTTIARDV